MHIGQVESPVIFPADMAKNAPVTYYFLPGKENVVGWIIYVGGFAACSVKLDYTEMPACA